MFTGIVQATGRIVSRRQAGDGRAHSRGRRYIGHERCARRRQHRRRRLLPHRRVDRPCAARLRRVRGDAAVHDGVRRGSARQPRESVAARRPAGRASDERPCRRSRYGRGLRAGRHRAPAEAGICAIEAPDELSRYIAPKGSIAVDGVSLTINAVDGVAIYRQPDPAHADRHDPWTTCRRRQGQSRSGHDRAVRAADARGCE